VRIFANTIRKRFYEYQKYVFVRIVFAKTYKYSRIPNTSTSFSGILRTVFANSANTE